MIRRSVWLEAFGLAALLLATLASRLPFRHQLLIRDEGELAYIGQAIRAGGVPYRDAYNQKTPLSFYVMAAFERIAGEDLSRLRLAGTFYFLIALALIYAAARPGGPWAALAAGAAFSAMVWDQAGVVHQASTEFFALPFIALAFLLYERRWALAAGAAAGLAFQTKQTCAAVLLYLLLAGWLELGPRTGGRQKKAVLVENLTVLAGFLLAWAGAAGWFAWQGAFKSYWECTLANNFEYIGRRAFDWRQALYGQRWDAGFWFLGLSFMIALRARLWRPLLLLVCLAGAALKSGPYAHYFLPLAVPLSLGWAFVFSPQARYIEDPGPLGDKAQLQARLVALAAFLGPVMHGAHIASHAPLAAPWPPFNGAPVIASYLNANTRPGDPVLVIGSEPEIYYYARRPAASRMIITYPMVAPYEHSKELEDKFFRELDAAKPKYIVTVDDPKSLTEWPGRLQPFLSRLDAHLRGRYRIDSSAPRAERLMVLKKL